MGTQFNEFILGMSFHSEWADWLKHVPVTPSMTRKNLYTYAEVQARSRTV